MIAAIQPILIKSVTTAVTVAVATAFKQMREELQAVETMKGEVERVRENMARLQAKLQTQHFDLDRQEQYSRKDSVRIYGIPEAEDERETNDIVRVAMYFRSTFVESCNQIHFWKAETSLKPKTNVSI